jgi:hypothetical protein
MVRLSVEDTKDKKEAFIFLIYIYTVGRSSVLTCPFFYVQRIYKSLSPHGKSLISLFLLSFNQAQARKEELQKLPEKVILSEVRQAVQKMQAVNQQLDEAVSWSHNFVSLLAREMHTNFYKKTINF